MTADDKPRPPPELARLGIARGGVAVGGLARAGYKPTAEEIVQRLLVEVAGIWQRLELLESAMTALQAARQEGGRRSKTKSRRELRKLVRHLDNIVLELQRQDKKSSLRDAAAFFYRTYRAQQWATLTTPEERNSAVTSLVRRYHRGKALPKKS